MQDPWSSQSVWAVGFQAVAVELEEIEVFVFDEVSAEVEGFYGFGHQLTKAFAAEGAV